jgi:hypothetical protein
MRQKHSPQRHRDHRGCTEEGIQINNHVTLYARSVFSVSLW